MLLRAFLVIISGFLFIFSPGLPMNLISRFSPEYKRDLVYWGIGVWIVSLIPSLFMQSLLRQFFYQGQVATSYTGQPFDFLVIFINSLISAFFLGLGTLLVLKYKKKKNPEANVYINGLAMGFGAGLVAQVFTGITLVGAGFQVLFGNTESNVTVSAIANSSIFLLIASMITLIVFRIALLAVSAVQGFLTARSVENKKGQFWAGVLVLTLFTFSILAIQLLMGEYIPGQVTVGITPAAVSIVTSIYYLLSFGLAYRWLSGQLQEEKY